MSSSEESEEQLLEEGHSLEDVHPSLEDVDHFTTIMKWTTSVNDNDVTTKPILLFYQSLFLYNIRTIYYYSKYFVNPFKI